VNTTPVQAAIVPHPDPLGAEGPEWGGVVDTSPPQVSPEDVGKDLLELVVVVDEKAKQTT
jgi:hypothetical protein